MKKSLLSIVLTSLLASSAIASDKNSPYIGGGLALESVDGFDTGIALVLNGGLPLQDVDAGPGVLALEGEFTYSLVPASNDYRWYGYHGSWDATIMTLGAYGAYSIDLNKDFYVKPRVGLIFRSIDLDFASDNELGLAFGVGAGYKINKDLSAYVNYNLVDGFDITHLTFGVEYSLSGL